MAKADDRSDGHERPHGSKRAGDGRDQVRGAHPTVRRSGRSRGTWIGLVIVLLIGGGVYVAALLGILGGG